MLSIERELQARSPSAVVGNAVVLTLMLYLLRDSSTIVLGFIAFNIALNLFRGYWVRRLSSYTYNTQRWNLGLGLILSGISTLWGLILSFVLLQHGVTSIEAVTVSFIMAGIAASAVAGLSARLSFAIVYVVMALGIPALVLTFMDLEGDSKFLPILFLICMVFFLSQARVQAKNFTEMLQQKELFRSIVDSVPMGVVLRTVNGDQSEIQLMNPQAYDIWDINKAAIGQSIDQVFGQALAIKMEEWAEASKKKKGARRQSLMIELRGEEKHLKRQTLYLDQFKAVLEIYEDVTQEKKTEKQIQELRASNIHKEKMASLGEMAGGIAHEINNPLAIIQGKVSQIRRFVEGPATDNSRIFDNLSKIEVTVGRIAKIIHGLRVFSRSGESDPLAEASLEMIAQEAMDLCLERFKVAGVNLDIEIKTGSRVECRHVQISQVIVNLLNNSFDAIQKLEQKWVKITLEDDADNAIIRVTDSGKGIRDPKVVAKLMQPFFTTKEIGKGTGLGLSISKGLIESHGGRFYLNQSSPHTEFVIELPKMKSAPQSQSA
jgi:signal transduction histidine kinase